MNTMSRVSPEVPTEEELVRRARDLIPWLRERADGVEKARRVPAETIDAFRSAGFFKILQPKRWGGYEMHPRVMYRVLMEVGRGCGSSAWNLMVLGVHQWEFGVMDPRAGDEVWGLDNGVLVSSSYAPFGRARKVDGGYIVNGTWKTSSGTDNAKGGAFLGAYVFDDQGRLADWKAFLVPEAALTRIDDWHVVGLAGTGSKSVTLQDDWFVPEHNAHSLIAYDESKLGLSPTYMLPFLHVFFAAVSSVTVGIAQGVLDYYVEHMTPRQNITAGGGAAIANPFVRGKLGQATVQLRGARARILQGIEEAWSYVSRGELIPVGERIQQFAEIEFTGRDAFEAAHAVFKKTATRGIWLDAPIQRQMRDILVCANHITQNEDDLGAVLGGYLLDRQVPALFFGLPTYDDAAQGAAA